MMLDGLVGVSHEQGVAALNALSPADRATLFRLQARERMAVYVWYLDIGLCPAEHHLRLIRELEAVERGDCDRLMVIFPPGGGKSTYGSVLFPPWFLGRNPKMSVIAASHTHDLAETFGRRVRNTFDSAEHRSVFGVGLSPDSKAADHWATDQGGEYFAIGVGGAVSGRRADLGLIDDPVKSREDADSERMRGRAWEWYQNDFKTRLKPGGRQVIITTRWHEDDLAGRILAMEGERWRILHLRMIAERDDPLGRAPGQRLWPEWFTAEMVDDARRDVRVWNALYQGDPTGEEGDYFRRDWFQEDAEPLRNLTIYGASDYAVTEGAGDFTEHGIFGIDAWSNVHVIDWWRGQESPDKWIEAQCDLIQKHKPLYWFGEAGPIRRAIEPFLIRRMDERRAWCRIEWLTSTHDKPTRCRPFQALAASGKVFFPANAAWKADVIGQLLRFPAGMHDDAVDTCSLIGRGLEHIHAPDIGARRMQTKAIVSNTRVKRYGR